MEFLRSTIPDVILIKPDVFGDERGYFLETYQEEKYRQGGIEASFVQDNQSGSRHGTLRGLHYQLRQTQGKLVRVISGEIYDVAVDLRRSSPTFGQWAAFTLSAENRHSLWVPSGFAHGFYVVSDWAEIAYKATDFYAPQWERSLLWNDPTLGIPWPIPSGECPILSAKDAVGSSLANIETFD